MVKTPEQKLIKKLREIENRNIRIASGLCYKCDAPVAEGKLYCQHHIDKIKAYNHIKGKVRRELAKTDYTRCKSTGCPHPPVAGKRHCQKHLDKIKKASKQWRRKAVEEGRCMRCGRPIVDWLGDGNKNVSCSYCSEGMYIKSW